jgi:hypothetical protein
MDHPHADRHRCLDALDIVYCSRINGQCLSIHSLFVPGSASLFRMQAAEHVTRLTFVFTTLVLIAATQGKQQDQYGDYAIQFITTLKILPLMVRV